MNVPNVPLQFITHTHRVKNLYKRALKNVRALYMFDIAKLRYESVLMRARFQNNICASEEEGKVLLAEGEKEYRRTKSFSPLEFGNSYGALNWNRYIPPPDWVLDYWHPLEKEQYPEYFARREQRKKEFAEMWDRTYSKRSCKLP